MEVINPVVEMLAAMLVSKYAGAVAVFAVISGVITACRFAFKLIPQLVAIYVAITPSVEDDGKAKEVEESKWYKTGLLVVDTLFSIKFPKKK